MNDYKKRRLGEPGSTPRAILGAGCRVPVVALPDGALRAAQHSLTFFPSNSFDRPGAPPLPLVLVFKPDLSGGPSQVPGGGALGSKQNIFPAILKNK